MKRATTAVLALALVGSLMFMGFAGVAAAGEAPKDKNDKEGEAPAVGEEAPVDQTAVAEVSQAQDVTQANVADQNADQSADQDATGIDVDVDVGVGDDDNNNGNVADALQNDNNDNNDNGLSVEIGTTGDQTIGQNIDQSADQSNSNAQVGEANAGNLNLG